MYVYIIFRYGNGYSVSLFFAKLEDAEEGINFVASRFPMSTHVQRHNATIQFRVPNEPPSVIFGHILANKGPLGIQDFAVKHTSLDEVSNSIGCKSCKHHSSPTYQYQINM